MRFLSLFLALSLMSSGCVGKKKYDALDAELAAERSRSAALEAQLASTTDRASVLSQQAAALQADVADLERALAQMRAREDMAKARVQAYQDLVARFAELIDAGTLRVDIVDGRMVLQIGTDILFPSGSADLSKEGVAALKQVGSVLATMADNEYQVEGHTDDVPIHNAMFASNWELSTTRATRVVQFLIGDGRLPAERLSAAGYAEHRPRVTNDSPDARARNRRVDIVVLEAATAAVEEPAGAGR